MHGQARPLSSCNYNGMKTRCTKGVEAPKASDLLTLRTNDDGFGVELRSSRGAEGDTDDGNEKGSTETSARSVADVTQHGIAVGHVMRGQC